MSRAVLRFDIVGEEVTLSSGVRRGIEHGKSSLGRRDDKLSMLIK